MIERWKMSIDKHGFAGGTLMELSKAFDTNPTMIIVIIVGFGLTQ